MASSRQQHAARTTGPRRWVWKLAALVLITASLIPVGRGAYSLNRRQLNAQLAEVLGCSDDVNEVQSCLRKGADFRTRASDGSTVLHFAAIYGDAAFVSTLVDRGMPVDALAHANRTPLMDACAAGRPDTARELLRRGADPNAASVDQTALGCAISSGNMELIRSLLRAGADPNRALRVHTPLTEAATLNRGDAVELLLRVGVPVDQRNRRGRTATMEAATFGRVDALEVLLRHGASATLKDPAGRDALTLTQQSAPGHLRYLRRIGETPAIIQRAKQNYNTTITWLRSGRVE